jgi:hypothetical protein
MFCLASARRFAEPQLALVRTRAHISVDTYLRQTYLKTGLAMDRELLRSRMEGADSMKSSTRVVIVTALLAMVAVVCTPNALAQHGCAALYVPEGPETGNFISGVWYAEGPIFIGHEELHVKVTVQDYGGFGLGKKSNTYKGKEEALYDFGDGNTFRTAITYVVEHFNDPDKGYLNAVETIIPGTGTGRFSNASGQFTTHGEFGVSDPKTMDGWATFTTHGAICGVGPAS